MRVKSAIPPLASRSQSRLQTINNFTAITVSKWPNRERKTWSLSAVYRWKHMTLRYCVPNSGSGNLVVSRAWFGIDTINVHLSYSTTSWVPWNSKTHWIWLKRLDSTCYKLDLVRFAITFSTEWAVSTQIVSLCIHFRREKRDRHRSFTFIGWPIRLEIPPSMHLVYHPIS